MSIHRDKEYIQKIREFIPDYLVEYLYGMKRYEFMASTGHWSWNLCLDEK